jgi:hypothetical protein
MLDALKRLMVLVPSLVILMPLAARAGDTDSCQAYAKAAIEQISVGASNPACVAGMQGPLWSPAFGVHFAYCMSNPIEVVEGGAGKRAEYLHSCGAIH